MKPTIDLMHLFGISQFVYSSDHSSRDALLFMVCSWLLAFASHDRVGLYCSDVSGAFDNVCRNMLIRKLNGYFHGNLVHVLSSWLAPRKANICVSGKMSNELEMTNMIFQGTVLGPILSNLFFVDAQNAVINMNFESTVCADDLNLYKRFPNHFSDAVLFENLKMIQMRLHS